MIVLFLLIVIVLVGLTAAAVMGRIGGFMAEPTASQAFPGLSGVSGVSADDIKQLRFDRALRGYRMDQVDEVVDLLGARVRELENEVASAGTEGSSHDVATDTQEH